ncbi:uncharacterized protein M6B38_302705 [Iris pallida]|uniref:RRM domain-containing protein n=1 Tax=Iris pallida TaxID=29817 RepID=A0AAX6HNN6_IRIPA|nr:uncharacterized protein M6B38_302705 [Iris pallida]
MDGAPMSYHQPEYDVTPPPAIPMHHYHHHQPPPPYHHHYYPNPNAHAPPPPMAAAAVVPVEKSDIHTLFIAGIPDDVKPREIHNLFRRRHGFDSCLLEYTGRGNQVVAFATFSNHLSAVTAMNELNGSTFDPATGATLHIELARSNSRRRSRGDGAYTIIDKRVKVKRGDREISSDDGDDESGKPTGTEKDNSSGDGAQKKGSNEVPQNGQSEKPLTDDIPPCSTLFIANLGPTCTEEELKQVLSECPGFETLKLKGKFGVPVAFADFSDVEMATEAREKLRVTSLASSDRGDMHVEYARSKMRKSSTLTSEQGHDEC